MKRSSGIARFVLLLVAFLFINQLSSAQYNLIERGQTQILKPTQMQVSGNLLAAWRNDWTRIVDVYEVSDPLNPVYLDSAEAPLGFCLIDRLLYCKMSQDRVEVHTIVPGAHIMNPIFISGGIGPVFAIRGHYIYYSNGEMFRVADMNYSPARILDDFPLPAMQKFEWLDPTRLGVYSAKGYCVLNVENPHAVVIEKIEPGPAVAHQVTMPEQSLRLMAINDGYHYIKSALSYQTDSTIGANLKYNIDSMAAIGPDLVAVGTSKGLLVYHVYYGQLRPSGQYLGRVGAMAAVGKYIYASLNDGPVRIYEYTGLPQPQPELAAEITAAPSVITMQPGQRATVQVTMKNIGAGAWTPYNHGLALIEDPNHIWEYKYPRSGIGLSWIMPGSDYTFSFVLKQPDLGAVDTVIRLQMVQEFVQFFGPVVEIPVRVMHADGGGSAAQGWMLFE